MNEFPESPELDVFNDLLRFAAEAYYNNYPDRVTTDEVDNLSSRLDDLGVSSIARQLGIDETNDAQMAALTEMMRDVRLKAEQQRSGENPQKNEAQYVNAGADGHQKMTEGQNNAWYSHPDDIGDHTVADVNVDRWYVHQGAAEAGEEIHQSLDRAQDGPWDPDWDPYIQRLIARPLTEEEMDLVVAALAKKPEEEGEKMNELDDSLMDI